MSQDDQRAREFLHNKYPDTTAEELQDETFICGDVVDFMVEFAEAAHQRGYEAGLEAAKLKDGEHCERMLSNACLLLVVVGGVAFGITLPLLLISWRAGIASMFVGMGGITVGFGGKMMLMLWDYESL